MPADKIMIIDDNREFLEELREMLYLSGYRPLRINDSSAALNAAKKNRPDLILLDLKMAKVNGFDLAQALKQCPQTSRIPIIAMSGYFPMEKESLLLDRSNMNSFIKKPFSVADIISRIEDTLRGCQEEAKDLQTKEEKWQC